MSKSMEVGIIIIPDDPTQKEAKKLHLSSLENLITSKIIDQENYEKNFPNNFHITLFQLRIVEDNLSLLSRIVEKSLADFSTLSFRMDPDLQDTQHHIFWASHEAENLPSLNKLHHQVVCAAKDLRDLSKPFSRANPTEKIFSEKQSKDIKEFGIFWGLPHNFNPHITIIYNSGQDRNGISIKKCIQNIKPKPLHEFHGKAIAIGELGPAGNVIKILKIIKPLRSPSSSQEGIFKQWHESKKPSTSNAILPKLGPISKL